MCEIKTDISRWEKTARQTPTWADRNRVIASIVPENVSVLDVGAGNMELANMIPSSCSYQPLDCVAGREDTIVYDFNDNEPPPKLSGFDIIICSGILEYMKSPDRFMRIVSGWGTHMIMSYATTDKTPSLEQRQGSGWFNHLSNDDVRRLIGFNGGTVVDHRLWSSQTIYEVEWSND